MGEAPRYRFGPRSTRGLIAGWRGGQIAAVAVGALLALGALRSVGGAEGAVLALFLAGAGVAFATWPVAGRTIEAWAPTVVRYASASLADGRALPWSAGARSGRGRKGPLRRLQLRMPPEGDPFGFAVIEDGEAGTWSAVLPVGSPGFALLDEPGRAEAVAAWSGVMAAMAAEGRSLRRFQWIARTFPADAAIATDLPAGTSESADAYRCLVGELRSRMWTREVLLVVTTDGPRSSPLAARRQADEEAAARRRLANLLASLSDRLAGAGLFPGAPHSTSELASSLRRAFELLPGGLEEGWPWPIGAQAHWASLRTDATWQATYWVSEWPRGEVGPGVLLPLLIGGAQRRAVSVTMAPLPPLSAVRRAERERTSGAADAELRRRHGFSLTARARAEQEVRLQREAELAEGHAAYLFSGYVAVTAADESALERACSEVEQAAALSQLELRRLYGAQEDGWCCTLPTGRGCG